VWALYDVRTTTKSPNDAISQNVSASLSDAYLNNPTGNTTSWWRGHAVSLRRAGWLAVRQQISRNTRNDLQLWETSLSQIKRSCWRQVPPQNTLIFTTVQNPTKECPFFLEMTDLFVARRCCFRKQFNVPRLPLTDTPWSLALGEQVTFHAFHGLVILCTGPSLSFPTFGYYKFFHFGPPSIVLEGGNWNP
jgi:hypothetical protein